MIIVIISVLFLVYVLKTTCVRHKKHLEDKLVVITGGSSGIGKSLAIECAKRKAHVVIIARKKQNLDLAESEIRKACSDPKQRVESFCCDVTDYDNVHNLIQKIDNDLGPIYMIVTCAGLAISAKLEDLTEADCKQMVSTNIYGTMYPVQAVVPLFKSRKSGHIVIMSSIAGVFGIFGFSVYSATKFAVRGFAEALHMELKNFNIGVTISLPPDTNTPGFEAENLKKPLETKLISENGGLYDPKIVANKVLNDALTNRYFSTVDIQSYFIKCLAVGFSPIDSLGNFILEVCILGFLRVIAALFLQYFYYLIRNVQKSK